MYFNSYSRRLNLSTEEITDTDKNPDRKRSDEIWIWTDYLRTGKGPHQMK